MIPSRYLVAAPSSGARKSRLEGGKPSLLPKPRQTCSTDRLSSEPNRPSGTGYRSSSAEPSRPTIGPRMSRDTSVTKQSMNARARSQQAESRYKQSMTTPLRSSQYSRQATTPMRTPEDRTNRNWEASLERAAAFVTVKDQRPLTSMAWQRAECARVGEALAARMEGGSGVLVRPLTIARFLDIVSALLSSISINIKLNNDNYVTKLPNLCKRLLYPGNLSKSWLRAVNTLHAFPHALALIAYLLDLVTHIETPVKDDWLYLSKGELAILRRKFLHDCWMRYQILNLDFSDLDEEYLRNVKALLGNDEEKIAELNHVIKTYESALEDETEVAARADEARRVERHDALAAALRAERAARLELRSRAEAERAKRVQHEDALRHLDLELERAKAENELLVEEVSQQPMSVDERSKLLDELKYSRCVLDSKRALADQVSQMVQSKDEELAVLQKKALYACFMYKQGLIQLTPHFPELSAYTIDENELMTASCADKMAVCVRALDERAGALANERSRRHEARAATTREHHRLQEEAEELKMLIDREQTELDSEVEKEHQEALEWEREKEEIKRRIAAAGEVEKENAAMAAELDYWQKQEEAWRTKLSEMREHIAAMREEAGRVLRVGTERRLQLVLDCARRWNEML